MSHLPMMEGAVEPKPLTQLCLDFISLNLDLVCMKSLNEAACDLSSLQLHPSNKGNNCDKATDTLRFIGFTNAHGQVLSQELAEELLTRISEMGKVTDLVLTLFHGSFVRLKHVSLKNADNVTQTGLQFLGNHNLNGLKVENLEKATVSELISALNSWTQTNLQSLNVSNSSFGDPQSHSLDFSALKKLPALTNLNVSGTEVNNEALDIIVNDLKSVEHLDISRTKIDDIKPILKVKHQLKSLGVAELWLREDVSGVLIQLEKLQFLDLSDYEDECPFRLDDFLCHHKALPNLVTLEISGRNLNEVEHFHNFVQNHPKLLFLGLMYSNLCSEPLASDPRFTVTGEATEKQLLESVRQYLHRDPYLITALYRLVPMTQNFTTPREDVIRLILRAAKHYPRSLNVQNMSIACLRNLCRVAIAKQLNCNTLKDVVEIVLGAMESFPTQLQLQKNCLHILCSNRILLDVSFDAYRCVKLVMRSVLAMEDNLMETVAVTIVSMIAPRLTTIQASQFGSNEAIVERLLKIVKQKVHTKSFDAGLKNTLAVLWSFSEDCTVTCQTILAQHGNFLLIEALNIFIVNRQLTNHNLGILSNFAKDPELRKSLMDNSFVSTLMTLLKSKEIIVSFMAAAVLAPLLGDESSDWSSITSFKKEAILNELENVILQWKAPGELILSYKSLQSCCLLVGKEKPFAVQLWGIWALNHVCTLKGDKYCPMLAEQGIMTRLEELMEQYDVGSIVKKLIGEVLESMQTNRVFPKA